MELIGNPVPVEVELDVLEVATLIPVHIGFRRRSWTKDDLHLPVSWIFFRTLQSTEYFVLERDGRLLAIRVLSQKLGTLV